MSDIARLKEKIKKDVRSLLISDPNGLTVQGLQNDYVNLCGGRPLPFREMGYSSITDFINDSPDVIRICYDRGRQILRAVGNESTAKIEKMVALQKNTKKRKFAPLRSSSNFYRPDFRGTTPVVNLRPCVTAYVRTEIHKLVSSHPNGIDSQDFCRYYYETFGYECAYRKFGFISLEDFLKSLSDIVYLETLPGGRYKIHKHQSDKQSNFRSIEQRNENLAQRAHIPRFNKEPQNESFLNRPQSTGSTDSHLAQRVHIPRFNKEPQNESFLNRPQSTSTGSTDSHLAQRAYIPRFNKERQNESFLNRTNLVCTGSTDFQKRPLSYSTVENESQRSFQERFTNLDSQESQMQAFSNKSATTNSKEPQNQYFSSRPTNPDSDQLQKQSSYRSTSNNESKNQFPYRSVVDSESQKTSFPYVCPIKNNESLDQEQSYLHKSTSVNNESPKQYFSLVDNKSQKQSFSYKPASADSESQKQVFPLTGNSTLVDDNERQKSLSSSDESKKQSFPYTERSTLVNNDAQKHIFPHRTIFNNEAQKNSFSYSVSPSSKDLHESFSHKSEDKSCDNASEPCIKSHNFKVSDKIVPNVNLRKDFTDSTSLYGTAPTNLETKKNINQQQQRLVDNRSPSPTLSNGILIKGKLKAELRKILENLPEGIKASKLQAEYKEKYHKDLNLKELGFFSIVELVSCIPDIVSLERPESMSDWILHDSRIHKSVYTFHPQPDPVTELYDEDNPKVMKSISPLSFKYLSNLKEQQSDVNAENNYPQITDDYDPVYSSINHRRFKVPSDAVGFHTNYSIVNTPKEVEYFEVYVSTVINPGKFWIQLRGEETSVMLLELMDYLEIVYNSLEGKNYIMPDTMIRIGQVCCAIYPNPVGEDDWHRAIITGIRDEDFVEVQYVDYGTVCSVPTSSLRMLKSQFLKFPMQAIPARLANLKPAVGEEWSKDATHFFMDLVREKPLLAKIMDYSDNNEIISLCLVDTSEEEDIHINDTLCNLLYAVHYNDYPSELSGSPNLETESEILNLNASHHSISNEEKLKPDNIDTTGEDDIFRQICEEIEDELILENCERKYVKKVTNDGLTFHVINYEGHPYLVSSEISSFLWKGDYVRAMLRMKRITVPSVVVEKDQCPELFNSFQNFNIKGVSNDVKPPESIVLYELTDVYEILKIFNHSSEKLQDAILEEINLYEAEDNYWMSSDSEKDDTDALIIDTMTTEELLIACQIFEACRSRILVAMTKHTSISDVNKLIDIEKQLEYIKKSLQSKPLLDQDLNRASSLSEGLGTCTTQSPNCFSADLDIWPIPGGIESKTDELKSSSAHDKPSFETESQVQHTTTSLAEQQLVTSGEVSKNDTKNSKIKTPFTMNKILPDPSTVTPFIPRSISTPRSELSDCHYTNAIRAGGPYFNVPPLNSLPPGIKTELRPANILPPGINTGPVFQNPPVMNPLVFPNQPIFTTRPIFPNQPVFPNRPVFSNQSVLPNQVGMFANQTSMFPNQPVFPNQNMYPNQTVYQNQFNVFANQSVLFPNSYPNF